MDKPENKKKITVKGVVLFLFLVLVSSVMWFFVSLDKEHEIDMVYTVYIKNVPDSVRFVTPDSASFSLKIKGIGEDLLSYTSKDNSKIEINYKDVNVRDGRIRLTLYRIKKIIEAKYLDKNLKLLPAPRDTLEFKVEVGVYRRPVELVKSISCAQNYRLVDITVNPDTVWVFGENASTVKCAYTSPMEYDDLRTDLNLKLDLPSVNGCVFNVGEVEVSVDVEPYIRRKIQVPVKALGFPEGLTLETMPSKILMEFDVNAENCKNISANDFIVGVKYDSLIKGDSNYAKVYKEKWPASATDISLSHPMVKCLIIKDGE